MAQALQLVRLAENCNMAMDIIARAAVDWEAQQAAKDEVPTFLPDLCDTIHSLTRLSSSNPQWNTLHDEAVRSGLGAVAHLHALRAF